MVRIIPYASKHREAFRQLNEAWITRFFKLEKIDILSLSDPEGYILDKGGGIMVAENEGIVIGVCALIPTEEPGVMELAKMAVDPESQGRQVGYRLGQAVIELARHKGVHKIVLESNTVLVPAIKLYEKLGFEKLNDTRSPYQRCNIKMALRLN